MDGNSQIREEFLKVLREEQNKLEEMCQKQKAEVERLIKEETRTADILTEGSLSPNGYGDPALKRIKEDAEGRLEKLYQHIKEELNKNHEAHRQEMQNAVNEEEKNWEEEYGNSEKIEGNCRDKLNELDGVSQQYQADIGQIDTDLDNIRQAIMAKIAKDYVRSDKGTRDTSSMYTIFGDEEEKVTKAAEFLEDIDNKLEKQCPLKSGAKK